MKYSSLKINGFRGIKTLSIEDLSQINLFVGKNNSGKSSILESLFVITGISNPKLILSVDNFRNLFHNEADDFRFIFYDLNYKNSLKLTAQLVDPDQDRELSIKSLYRIRGGQQTENTSAGKIDDNLGIDTASLFEESLGLEYNFSVKERHKQTMSYKAEIIMESATKEMRINTAKKYQEKVYGVFISPMIQLANLHKRLEELIIAKKKESLIGALKFIDSSIVDITIGSNKMIYFDIGIDRLIPANIMGDGIIKLLTIITNIFDARNGMVFIDEIDNGLHFSTLKDVWSIIIGFAIEYNAQLFISTHNIECLKFFNEALKEPKTQDIQDKVRSYTISKVDRGNIKSFKYSFDEFEYAISSGVEIRGEF